jgi:hypothetical protein
MKTVASLSEWGEEVDRYRHGARMQQEIESDDTCTVRYAERIVAAEALLTILPENERAKLAATKQAPVCSG